MSEVDIYTQSINNYDYIGEAWQYKVRKQKAIQEASRPYWETLDLSISNSVVRPVSYKTAKYIIEEYEWLGCMPATSSYYFGIYFKDTVTSNEVCGGVVVYGPEYVENRGAWDRYGWTGKIILLARGVCLHWTPKNTNSHLIMESIKQLPPKYEVITCTIDHLAGEVGTIYQACNFDYVGSMRGEGASRLGAIIDGKMMSDRGLRSRYGTSNPKKILEIRPDAQFVKQKCKDRYFYFRGDKKTRKRNRKPIESMIKPYPKRGAIDDTKEIKEYPQAKSEEAEQFMLEGW